MLSRVCWQLRGEGQKHYDNVAREYIQAADMYPNNADVIYSLGQIHQQAGNYDKAIDAYTLAMRDSVVEVLARTSAASCFLAQGKPEAAIQQLEQALQSVRRSPNALDPGIWAARPREGRRRGIRHQRLKYLSCWQKRMSARDDKIRKTLFYARYARCVLDRIR